MTKGLKIIIYVMFLVIFNATSNANVSSMTNMQIQIWTLRQSGNYEEAAEIQKRLSRELESLAVVQSKPMSDDYDFPKKMTLANGAKGVFKIANHQFPNDSAEIGAFRIDLLFNLNLVPTTVKRIIDGQEGSLQLFVEGGEMATNRGMKREDAPREIRLLDFLTRNIDRHGGNWLYLNGTDRLVAIDNDQSFALFTRPDLDVKFEPSLEVELTETEFKKFKQITKDEISKALQGLFANDLEKQIVNKIETKLSELLSNYQLLQATTRSKVHARSCAHLFK